MWTSSQRYQDIDDQWGKKSKEATEAFQRDYNVDPVDGVFGNGTLDMALKVIPTGKMPTASIGTDSNTELPSSSSGGTGTFWDDIEFFSRDEFKCQCGGKYCNGFPVEPDEKMVRTVNEIRRRLGVPVYIVDAGGSGVRCDQHNIDVGGVPNSEHKFGRAADLHSSTSPERMKEVAEEVMGRTGGIGIYSWGIHVDVGKYSRWTG